MFVWLVPLAVLIPAAWIDWRTHEVPDLVPLCLVVWLLACWALGWAPASSAALAFGALAAFLPALLLWHLGGLGGGDVKLLLPLGGLAGWPDVLVLLASTAVAGGLLAGLLLWRGGAERVAQPSDDEARQGEGATAEGHAPDGRPRAAPELAYVPAIAVGWASLCLLRWELLT